MANGSKEKIIVAVQARMNSTRLPGKPLIVINGKTMLEHLLERVSLCKGVDRICVSTTKNPLDDKIVELLDAIGTGYFRGHEDDIAGRLFGTAKKFKADVLVRVWGDCPLIDPGVVTAVLEQFLLQDADFATNSEPPSYPFGMNVEVYSVDALRKITLETMDAFYREFPIEFIKANSGFKMINVSFGRDVSSIKLTVDYDKDVVLVETIMKKLAESGKVLNIFEIVRYCEENSGIFAYTRDLPRNIEYKEELETRKNTKMPNNGGAR